MWVKCSELRARGNGSAGIVRSSICSSEVGLPLGRPRPSPGPLHRGSVPPLLGLTARLFCSNFRAELSIRIGVGIIPRLNTISSFHRYHRFSGKSSN